MAEMNTKVTLDEHEQMIARFIASLRQHENRTNNVKDQATKPNESYRTELNGYGAELAFCKIMNLYPDLTFQVRSHGYDCLSVTGTAIDVKTTTYQNGKLLAAFKNPDVEVYALMIGEFPTYTFVGWIEADKLINEMNLTDFGYGKSKQCYALPQDHLNRPETLHV